MARLLALPVYIPDIIFVVASDDPDWTSRNLRSSSGNGLRIEHTSQAKLNTSEFDFAVLSSCNHSIFDYGSYGFWSAFLAGGKVRI